jgi:Helix-turn-helix domain
MRAIVRGRYGSADVLEVREVPVPDAGDGEVLVRVRAAGLDRGVWHIMAGLPRQLQRAFAEVGGTSFSAYLRTVRLRNAAQLLRSQPLSVRQVSLLVGYRQPAHFAKAFRRRYGVTPAAYRARAARAKRRASTDSQAERTGMTA